MFCYQRNVILINRLRLLEKPLSIYLMDKKLWCSTAIFPKGIYFTDMKNFLLQTKRITAWQFALDRTICMRVSLRQEYQSLIFYRNFSCTTVFPWVYPLTVHKTPSVVVQQFCIFDNSQKIRQSKYYFNFVAFWAKSEDQKKI